MDRVVVFRSFDLAEAQVIRSQLEGAGIEAEVEHENSAALLDVAVGGARVTVAAEKADEARALIEQKPGTP
jgi:hypothetical protein